MEASQPQGFGEFGGDTPTPEDVPEHDDRAKYDDVTAGTVKFLASGEPVLALGGGKYGRFAEVFDLEDGQETLDEAPAAPEPAEAE